MGQGEAMSEQQMDGATARYLEHICRSMMQAVNDRNFDLSKEPWTFMAPQFRNDPTGRSDAAAFLPDGLNGDQCSSEPGRPQTNEEHMDFHRRLAAGAPQFCHKVLDFSVTMINENANHATAIMFAETYGIPPGVIRPSLSTLDFRRLKGTWMLTRLRTLPGWPIPGQDYPEESMMMRETASER